MNDRIAEMAAVPVRARTEMRQIPPLRASHGLTTVDMIVDVNVDVAVDLRRAREGLDEYSRSEQLRIGSFPGRGFK